MIRHFQCLGEYFKRGEGIITTDNAVYAVYIIYIYIIYKPYNEIGTKTD